MIFEPNEVIERGETMYHSLRLLFGEETSYRQVYFAQEGSLLNSKERMVSLIVYDLDNLPPDYALAPEHETDILRRANGRYCPLYRGKFEYERQDHHYWIIITESYWSSTLREVITENGANCPDHVRAQLLACVINGVRFMMEKFGKVYLYDLSPDNIVCYFSPQGKVGIRFANLNLVRFGPDDEYAIDVDLIPRDFCPPEMLLSRFQESSMQWSLAALTVYVLTFRHPYDVNENMGLYETFLRYKKLPKPDVNICETLNYSLKKALSIGVSYRLDSLDQLMDEILQFLTSQFKRYTSTQNAVAIKPSPINIRRGLDLQDIIDHTREFTAEDQMYLEEEPFETYNNDIPVQGLDTMDTPESYEYKDRAEMPELGFAILKGDGFKGIAGYEDLKEQLRVDFVNVVNNLSLAKMYGIRPPGMLFFGAPGTGKTYIAEHLGQELGVEVSIIKPSTLGSIYVHGSQRLISDLFQKAENKARQNSKGVLLVFDEVDAMTSIRSTSEHNHSAEEVAEFLTQLNNCSERGIFVIGTTNCIERIDPAVMRKGRLDKIIFFDLPEAETRRKIFEYELNKLPHVEDLDLDKLAVMTEGFTSSDISFITSECARVMFAKSLELGLNKPLDITQEVLEQTVLKTRPSVSKAEMKRYYSLYDKYVNADTSTPTTRVGFNTAP